MSGKRSLTGLCRHLWITQDPTRWVLDEHIDSCPHLEACVSIPAISDCSLALSAKIFDVLARTCLTVRRMDALFWLDVGKQSQPVLKLISHQRMQRILLRQDFSKTPQSGIYYFNNKCLKDQALNTEACLTLPKKILESVFFKMLRLFIAYLLPSDSYFICY